MKKIHYHLICMLLIAVWISACSSEVVQEEINEAPKVSFVLYLGESTASSRATYGEEEGSYDYDNQIDPDGLQVILYDQSTKEFLGQVESMTITRISINTYRFVGSLKLEPGVSNTLNCRVMIFANCDDIVSLTNKSTSNSLQPLSYTYSSSAFSYEATESTKRYIPMWGVKQVNIEIVPGSRQDIGTINLLRAMAKVQVVLDESVDGWELSSVEHSLYQTTGLIVPSTYDNMTETERVTAPSIPASGTRSTTLVNYITVNPGREYIIYLPEYSNVTSGVEESTIEIGLTRGAESKSYTLYFKDYSIPESSTTNPWNIVRNYYYKFRLTGLLDEFKLYYTVEEWASYTINIPDFE